MITFQFSLSKNPKHKLPYMINVVVGDKHYLYETKFRHEHEAQRMMEILCARAFARVEDGTYPLSLSVWKFLF